MALEMKYFVLKPKGNNPWAAASRKAMRAFADHIEDVDLETATSLRVWADTESKIALAEEPSPSED